VRRVHLQIFLIWQFPVQATLVGRMRDNYTARQGEIMSVISVFLTLVGASYSSLQALMTLTMLLVIRTHR